MVQTRNQSRKADETTVAEQKPQGQATHNAQSQSPSKPTSHNLLGLNHRGQKQENEDERKSDPESPSNNTANNGQGLQQMLHRILDKHEKTPLQQLIDEKWPASNIVMVHIPNALLSSTRISHHIASETLRCLVNEDYHDLTALHESSWQRRTEILTKGGYTHYRERTATYLGDLADLMKQKYDNDASNILQTKEHRVKLRSILRDRLKEIKGLGPIGCDIFLGTVQGFCPNVAPYLDQRNLEMAQKIGLSDDLDAMFRALHSSPMDMAKLQEALTSERLDH